MAKMGRPPFEEGPTAEPVQTRLPRSIDKAFRAAVEQKGMTVSDGLLEAILCWLSEQQNKDL